MDCGELYETDFVGCGGIVWRRAAVQNMTRRGCGHYGPEPATYLINWTHVKSAEEEERKRRLRVLWRLLGVCVKFLAFFMVGVWPWIVLSATRVSGKVLLNTSVCCGASAYACKSV
jgi:hypothetical protein